MNEIIYILIKMFFLYQMLGLSFFVYDVFSKKAEHEPLDYDVKEVLMLIYGFPIVLLDSHLKLRPEV